MRTEEHGISQIDVRYAQQAASLAAPLTQLRHSLVEKFFVPQVASIPGVNCVYSTDEGQVLYVTTLVREFWGKEFNAVNEAIYDFRGRFGEASVEFEIVPEGVADPPTENSDDVAILYQRDAQQDL